MSNILHVFHNRYIQTPTRKCTAVIVGKGPSIATLTKWELVDGVDKILYSRIPFCLGEAMKRIAELYADPDLAAQPWYGVKQDLKRGFACIPTPHPTYVFMNKVLNGMVTLDDQERRIAFYSPGELGCEASTLTSVVAVKIARLMGINEFIFAGFDSWADHKALGYWSGVDYSPSTPEAGSAERFIQHQYDTLRAAQHCRCSVRMPMGECRVLPMRDGIPFVPKEWVTA